MWNPMLEDPLFDLLNDDSSMVAGLHYVAASQRVVAVDVDGAVRVFDVSNFNCVQVRPGGDGGYGQAGLNPLLQQCNSGREEEGGRREKGEGGGGGWEGEEGGREGERERERAPRALSHCGGAHARPARPGRRRCAWTGWCPAGWRAWPTCGGWTGPWWRRWASRPARCTGWCASTTRTRPGPSSPRRGRWCARSTRGRTRR